MPRPSLLSSFWIFSFFLSFSACCEMPLPNATADGINTLGGCCAKLVSTCKGMCADVDVLNWRDVPNGLLIFKRETLSEKLCGPCRKSYEWKAISKEAARVLAAAEAAALATEAVAARFADLKRRVPPLGSPPRASGESFDDEVNRYVLIT
jgi:hypothetical protein